MSVMRIDEFRALENRQGELQAALAEILPAIRTAAGCLSLAIYRSAAEPERLLVFEEWTDAAAHEAALAAIPPGTLHKVMALLADLPSGGYFIPQG